MILEGNTRGYGAELARHLLNPRENDHVTVHLVDGFVADDLHGAFAEAEAISGATRCKKYLFSLSLNPPPDQSVSVDQFEAVIARAAEQLGFKDQPHAVVFHEKNGRRHAHVVWSRIDAGQMKAIDVPHFKRKLFALSRQVYLEHGWDMPDGFKAREDRDPLNTSRAESQQAKRCKRDRVGTKAMFQACWAQSDSKPAFEAALQSHGYMLARGQRRGFVAVDADGKVWSLSRWCGVTPKALRARLGPEYQLPYVDDVLAQVRDLPPPAKEQPSAKFALEREEMIARQRAERAAFLEQQTKRRNEERKRQNPRGMSAVFLKVTGQWKKVVAQAEARAKDTEARDQAERQALIDRQMNERQDLNRRHGQTRTNSHQHLVLPQDGVPFTAQQVARRPELVLADISQTKASFTRIDVLLVLSKRIDNPQQLTMVADAALRSREAVRLSSDRIARYTTRDYQRAEAKLHAATNAMHNAKGFGVTKTHVKAAITAQNGKMRRAFGGRLSDEQGAALRHILMEKQCASVVGLAGAGKSTMLEAANDAWTRQGVTVHGAALAGKAADGLESASGIKSRTLASLELSWENGNTPIAKGDVLIVDEAGMIGTRQMARVASKCQSIGAKLVLVGDPEQLQPIEAGTPFRDMVARHGASELLQIYRQRNTWQRAASKQLAAGETAASLNAYKRKGHVTEHADRDQTIDAVAATYAMDVQSNPSQTRLAFAHRRKDVHALNLAIRDALRSEESAPETLLQTATGPRAFASGDRFVFGKNDNDLGVKNGMLGTVTHASEMSVRVALDGDMRRSVTFDPRAYQSFDHGYAVTVHKSQGATVDQAYVLASRTMDRHLAYVAMTRHRDDLDVFISGDDAPSWAKHAQVRPQRPSRSGPSRG